MSLEYKKLLLIILSNIKMISSLSKSRKDIDAKVLSYKKKQKYN